ncbi:hypothetical protein [uncultured Dysosmobacter sp.]|uniref:hypothetical protein n=1 Tax=uncultured Dysosmobacter sp. TaxID=2591384 RepID=UPI00263669C7|nr:hypothetical protein [uncultured Dysosmobacter sp.]
MRAIEELRPLTAGRLLTLWREAREAGEDALERTLRCNGAVLAETCFFQGAPVFENGEQVLEELTGMEMEGLLRRLAAGGQPPAAGENPAFDEARFDTLRKE